MNDLVHQEQQEGLPLDPLTLLIGLRKRWRIFVIFALGAVIWGGFCAVKFGINTWEAETALLYQPTIIASQEDKHSVVPPLTTQIHMVKLHSNLEETRTTLGLDTSVQGLSSACKVDIAQQTDLMFIRCNWGTAEDVATLTNTLRDVFLKNQLRLRRMEASKQIREVEGQLDATQEQLDVAMEALQKFSTTHNVIDFDQEIQWYLDEFSTLDLRYEQARIDQRTVELQSQNIDRIGADMKRRVADEQKRATEQTESLANLNIRSERLRKAIVDEKNRNVNQAELALRKAEYERAQKLKKRGLIPDTEFDKIRSAYEKQQALALDTEQIRNWKHELDKLHTVVLPPNIQKQLPSRRILDDILMKTMDTQMQQVALAERVTQLENSRRNIRRKLTGLKKLHLQFLAMNQEIEGIETEKKRATRLLAQLQRVYESQKGDFSVISTAQVPPRPEWSNRRIIFVGVALCGTIAGFFLIMLLELKDTTIKSEADLAVRLGLPVLGVLPKLHLTSQLFSDETEDTFTEHFKIIARRIRRAVPKKGARILLVSAKRGEGQTVVTANLAACLGRQDEYVMLLEGNIRRGMPEGHLHALVPEDVGTLKGLGEYLSYEADKMQEVVSPTVLPGVECLPVVGEAVIPDLLGTHRMHELLEKASELYSIVLLDGPPALPYVDAEILAQWADAIIFVVRSRSCPSSTLQKSIDHLQQVGTPIIGVILNDVEPIYFRDEQRIINATTETKKRSGS